MSTLPIDPRLMPRASGPLPPRPRGLGGILANLTGGAAVMPPLMAQPNGPGGNVLMNAVQPAPLPAPVPRQQSASPGAGGIAPPPTGGGEPVRPSFGEAFDLPRVDVMPNLPPVAAAPAGSRKLSRGQIIAGIVADGLAGFTGQPPMVAQMWQRQRELADQRSHEEARWHRDRQAKSEDAMRPRVEQVGDALGTYDPVTKTFEPIYTKPQPFEAYARARGYQPGTPEYAEAVEDYRLGSWSDPAFENRSGLEDVRSRGRTALEILRGANRLRDTETRMATSRENNIRTTGTSAANNRRTTGQSNINNLRTTTTTQGSASYQGRGGRGGGSTARIVNPQTGQAMVLRNGQWVPER